MDKPYLNLIGHLLDEIDDPDHMLNQSHGRPLSEHGDGLSDCSHHEQTNSPSHSAASQHSAAAIFDPIDFPTKVCTFHLNGLKGIGQGCLRINCSYFHGTEEQLAELRQRAANEKETGTISGEAHPLVKRVKRSLADVDLGDKRAIVCLAYLSNSCRRPGCRFLHLPPNIRPLPIAVCDRNLRGVCTLRHRCRFYHGKQEDLSRMHAEGVTMYNPFTLEPHDPTATLDDLMKLQTQTTIPATENSNTLPLPPMPAAPPQQLIFVVQVPPAFGGQQPAFPYPAVVNPSSPFTVPMLPYGPPVSAYTPMHPGYHQTYPIYAINGNSSLPPYYSHLPNSHLPTKGSNSRFPFSTPVPNGHVKS